MTYSPNPAPCDGETSAAPCTDDAVRRAADEQFRRWMLGHLARAAADFGVTLAGTPVFGWYLRSAGAQARGAGGPFWLRVGTERDADLADPYLAAFWTGAVDATAITGVTRPRVVRSTEWPEPDHGRRVRADLTTLLPGTPAAPVDVLTAPPQVDDRWWSQLRSELDTLAEHTTTRFAERRPAGSAVRAMFGDRIAEAATSADSWHTVHGDLHWGNVMTPEFGLLDWEFWGHGPAGYDAATLYLFSLLVPDTAARVHEVFADILDTLDGQRAQIAVAARILSRAGTDTYRSLAPVVSEHIAPILHRYR